MARNHGTPGRAGFRPARAYPAETGASGPHTPGRPRPGTRDEGKQAPGPRPSPPPPKPRNTSVTMAQCHLAKVGPGVPGVPGVSLWAIVAGCRRDRGMTRAGSAASPAWPRRAPGRGIPGIVSPQRCHRGDSLPPEGTFEGKHRRGRLTAMRQMPVITGPPSPAHAAQAKRHCAMATETAIRSKAGPGSPAE
jgi:hypothetical protein